MKTKLYNEFNLKQQALYKELALSLENWGKSNKELTTLVNSEQILEVLITLTLAMKALYVMQQSNPNGAKSNETGS